LSNFSIDTGNIFDTSNYERNSQVLFDLHEKQLDEFNRISRNTEETKTSTTEIQSDTATTEIQSETATTEIQSETETTEIQSEIKTEVALSIQSNWKFENKARRRMCARFTCQQCCTHRRKFVIRKK